MSTPQVADISTQKKANRKKSKKASAEGASSPTDANNVNEVTALLKLIPEQLEPSQDPATDLKRENEAMKEISKREKKLRKKILLIEGSEEKIKDLTEEEKAIKLNADERRKISEKPVHLAVHKELKDVMDILIKHDAMEEKRITSEKAQVAAAHAAELEKAIVKAKEEGRKEATDKADEDLQLLLSFLRNVSLRRSWAANGQVLDPSEEKAFEAALIAVYEGTDNALAACNKLFSGLDEPVKEGATTWTQLKELCTKKPEATEEEAAQVEAAFEGSDVPEASPYTAEPVTEVISEDAPAGDAPAEENIVIEKEAVMDSMDHIVILAEDIEAAPPAVTTTGEAAANIAAEYPSEPATEQTSTPAVETDPPVLTEAALNTQAEPVEEAAKTTDEAPKTNGTYNGGGRGGHRGGFRGYRGHRGNRGDRGDRGDREHRVDGYRPRGDYRGHRGDHRSGEGRGSYGGGRGDRGDREGYRSRGDSGRASGYRGRGPFQQNPQQQPQTQGI